MKPIKGISTRIFIAVLLTGIVGISGLFVMKYTINRLSEQYESITKNQSKNRTYMTDISILLYRHQALVADASVADDIETIDEYQEKAKEISVELKKNITALGNNMQGTEAESLYHDMYSDAHSYLKNADNVFSMCKNGRSKTAKFYITSVMGGFVEGIDDSLDKLDRLVASELTDASAELEGYIRTAVLSRDLCSALIFAAIIICLYSCVKLSLDMDRYKDSLEIEVDKKTEALREQVERLNELQNNTIIAMANLIENRDGDTGEHIKRTSSYVYMLAKAAKEAGYEADELSDEYIELLKNVAPMHDIGKITIPDNILKKPGRLTDEEFEKIKAHSVEGGRIIREVLGDIESKEYVETAATVATYHHEKWNGMGYPEGLKGKDIPLCARIMAIADVFDALVSKRCYKDAMTFDEAFNIIENSSGSHFDPTLAKLFIELRDEVEKKYNY